MEPIHTPVPDPSGTAFMLFDDELDKDSDEEEVLAAGDDMDEDPQDDKEVRTPSPKQDQPEPSHTDKLVEASMSSLDRSSTTISDLYKGLNVITELLKDIYNAVKDDLAINQKLNEATKTFIRISSNIDKGKGIVTESGYDPSKKLVKASSIICPDPDEPVRVKFMINGKIVYLTEQEIQDYYDKEEQIKKAEEEARLLTMTKPEVGEMFKKAQDTKHDILKSHHTEKVKKSLELRKHKYNSYMWTVSSRLKPEPITDIKIYPKTKPVVITVDRGTDGRNIEVYEPFLFGAFYIFEMDKLREISPKMKNAVVKDLMNSLSQRYKRLQQIPKELGIHPALPAPEQVSS
ncbi:hypothetical protein Tco_0155159 [Tanacetum coccineum]